MKTKKLKNNKYKSNRNNKRLLFFYVKFLRIVFLRNVLCAVNILKYKDIFLLVQEFMNFIYNCLIYTRVIYIICEFIETSLYKIYK